MDKNLAALLREDTYTLSVRFYRIFQNQNQDKNRGILSLDQIVEDTELSPKKYKYVTNIPDIQVNDQVVVYVNHIPVIALVVEVDGELKILPNESTSYKWVVSKLDTSYYDNLCDENTRVTNVVAEAYRQNTKKAFRDTFMVGLDDKSQALLTSFGRKK